MKKRPVFLTVVIIIAVLIVQLIMASCVFVIIPALKNNDSIVPEDGVFCCDELLTAIDFTAMHESGYTDCAIKYTDASKKYYENVYPKITQGSNTIGIEIDSLGPFKDYKHYYVTGICDYSDGKFTITSETPEKVYTFIRTDDESIDSLRDKAELLEEDLKDQDESSEG